jgi:CopG family transcriptional regulator, nickel-responsive regulator
MKKEKIKRFSVTIPDSLYQKFDSCISHKDYSSRSESIRDLIRDYLFEDNISKNNIKTIGSITIVYNHSESNILNKIIKFEHHFHEQIITSMHIHLDTDNCLEVIIIKGQSETIKEFTSKLSSIKGVKYAKYVLTPLEGEIL